MIKTNIAEKFINRLGLDKDMIRSLDGKYLFSSFGSTAGLIELLFLSYGFDIRSKDELN